MKSYRGYRMMMIGNDGEPVPGKCMVIVEMDCKTRQLDARLDLRRHSPDGFEWGYGGSGPAQLALALVADCCGERRAVPAIYQRFKERIVSRLAHDGWTLDEQYVRAVVAEIVAELGDVPV